MTSPLIERAEQRDYQKLFLQDLNWSRPDQPPITYDHEGRPITATNISSYKGLRVWVVNEKPDSKLEAALDQHLAKTSTDRIVIFHDHAEQVWRWPVRRAVGNTTTTRLSRHKHRNGDPDPRFAAKLDAIRLPQDLVLDSNTVLAKVRQAFDIEAQNETKHASKLMARLYAAMEKAYPATKDLKVRDHEISVTLARLLFLMFGDDTDMWPEGLFQDFILDHTAADGSDIGAKLTELFAYLDTRPRDRGDVKPEFTRFRYVNGGIFKERLTLPVINAEFRAAVLDACDRDWKTISPAIFGSMFQSVRDAQTRRELGEHYTSEENILRTLNPLFLDELRAEFEHVKTLGKYEADRLRKLRDKLGRIRYLDPACGCGNFIIVAYRELRELELAIMERLQEITGDPAMLLANYGLKVTLDHFYGIEIDEWPARIAETAMFLIDRQCDLKLTERLGWAPDRLPIEEQATIVSNVSALKLDWAQVCPPTEDTVVAGNPPFLGHATRSEAQAEELRDAWGKDDISRLDYVTGWHARSLDYFRHTAGRFAFVTTNSITQGDPVPHLFAPIFDAGWRIKFAHRTFPWTSEAAGKAAVHCVIIGFAKNLDGAKPRLFDHPGTGTVSERQVATINAYLIDGPNVFVTKRSAPLVPHLPEATFGNMPRDDGNLIVTPNDYDAVHQDPVARRYLRPFLGAEEVLHGKQRWCLWLTGLDPSELSRSTILRERIDAVRHFRLKSSASSTRQMAQTPHLFGQRPALYNAPYLIIPGVSSELRDYYPVRRVGPEVIASNLAFTAGDPTGLLFAIISSAMFMAWQRTVGGRLESRLRFSNTIVWNNLPLPDLQDAARQSIIAAGRSVEEARDHYPQLTLADLYRPEAMPRELREAHRILDTAVDNAFGARGASPSLEERQRVLFQRFEDLAGSLTASPRGKTGRR
ncbi:class I SAM-dependent DNA methyltransferase [Tessaracoccus sp. MC1627]|uniref:class I SAM-dependent DNA methyltransferase n=1 Tax=Tessaracoccus sp. MC1627 TaxID=2760312 RepID=UPI0016028D36|nr:DNA methyltransferase [Tessaracoccus sp. MC1627]MBB1514194.1 class I SAM-dependent DNA methyltransferase [Tessaracoccus sp. MC1627]